MEHTEQELGSFARRNLKNQILEPTISHITTSGDGNFVVQNTDQAIHFPENGDAVDFVAYYPFTSSIANYVYKVDILDQTKPANIDLLYSDNARNLNNRSSAKVGLVFTHQLTKIRINIAAGTGIGSLTGLSTKAIGLATKANFDLTTGVLTTETVSINDLKFVTQTSNGNTWAEAIVLPSAGSNNRKVLFSLNGKLFNWSVPDATEFVKGKVYTYNAVISSEAVIVVNPNATITDWNEVPSGDIEAEFDNTPPTISLNQTAETLNGLDENATITLTGDLKSVVDISTAKMIVTDVNGVEVVTDLLGSTYASGLTALHFEKNITATTNLRKIAIEVVNKNEQRTVKELGVHVGYYYYHLNVTASGNGSSEPGITPFISAVKGKSYSYCEAKDVSESVEVAFSTFTGNTQLSVTNVAKRNAGKFQHLTCDPKIWSTITAIPLTKAANIKRSNFNKITINEIRQETPLTTGGTVTTYLSGTALDDLLDIAIIYQVSVGGVNKKVALCIDRVDKEIIYAAVPFTVHVVIEK